jgi:sortase A
MRKIFWLIGIACIGYYGLTIGTEKLNQSYDNWQFEKHISGQQDALIADYLREETPLGFLVKDVKPEVTPTPPDAPMPNVVLGRVEIDRLSLSAIVREGVDATTLKNAVGHVPSTALPGHLGNFALAAHRDTLFRALKDIKQDDLIKFEAQNHETYTYRVQRMKIVKPTDVSVLQADGHESLTLITCYPFYYVGSAPERFIVRAELVSKSPTAQGQLAATR